MNVVVVNDFAYVNGGASKVALGSARALALRGHRVVLVTAVGPVDPSLADVPNLEVRCLGQHDLLNNPSRLAAAVSGLWNRRAAAEMDNVLRNLSPRDTVVHIHIWAKALTSSVVRVASDLGFPVLLTLHDFLAACPTGTLFQHGTQTICTLKPMSFSCICSNCDSRSYSQKLWRVARQLVQLGPGRLPSGVENLISISPTSTAVMQRYLPNRQDMLLIGNPVEVERAPAVELRKNRRFVFVGRLAAEKGPLLFARAAHLAGVEAFFLGDGELGGAVRGVNPQATISGWKSTAEVNDLLKTARALVFPSLWYETQGLVVAEALALGIPAIVADTSAARDWITDGQTGLLFRGGDEQDLAAKLLALHEDTEGSIRMGREAYKRYWAAPASMEHHVMSLERAYVALCHQR